VGVAVVEVVGERGADVGGETDHVERGLLRAVGESDRNTNLIAGEAAAEVHLVAGEIL
jgi:hypothetical protein